MTIFQFINSSDEIIDNENDKILEWMIEAYAEDNEQDHEIDEEKINIVSVKTSETLTVLFILQLFAEQQEYKDRELIWQLNHFEQIVRIHEVNEKQQSTIISYFS